MQGLKASNGLAHEDAIGAAVEEASEMCLRAARKARTDVLWSGHPAAYPRHASTRMTSISAASNLQEEDAVSKNLPSQLSITGTSSRTNCTRHKGILPKYP